MNRRFLTFVLTMIVAVTVGCASKKYVRNETAPLINKTNDLDDLTAKNTNAIKDMDTRAQTGIKQAQSKADAADQQAANAGQAADKAQTSASSAVQRADALGNTVANLDNYRPVSAASVLFGFDKDNLTKQAKADLDQLAANIENTKGYIITVEGATDSVGSAEYNYELSQRRANAVIQYLASEHNVPAHKIYLIGLGKDKPAESNKTAEGRAKNRRVDVKLMTNVAGEQPQQKPAAAPSASPSSM
jgi:outer membrane protein OmpA-like peptidoglycan-associated protein